MSTGLRSGVETISLLREQDGDSGYHVCVELFCARVTLDSPDDETLIGTSCVNLCRDALDAQWW